MSSTPRTAQSPTERISTAISYIAAETKKTHQEIANELGVSLETLSNLLHGRGQKLPFGATKRFLDRYRINPEWLENGSGSMLVDQDQEVDSPGQGGVAERLRAARNVLRVTQEQMAKLGGLHRPNYNRIESGLRKTPVDALATWAIEKNLSIDWLLTGQGSMFRGQHKDQDSEQNETYRALGKMIGAMTKRIEELEEENARLKLQLEHGK